MALLFITPKHIMRLTGQAYLASWRKWRSILDAYGKRTEQGLTIYDYCHYHGISKDEVLEALGQLQK